jgi:hypothetical protein
MQSSEQTEEEEEISAPALETQLEESLASVDEEEEDVPRRRRGRKSRTSQIYQRRLTAPVTPMTDMTGRYDTLAELTPARKSKVCTSVMQTLTRCSLEERRVLLL